MVYLIRTPLQATVGARVHHGAVMASLHDTVEGLPEAVKALRQADWLLSWSGGCHVIELHKIRLFIYIPWSKSGLLTGLFGNNVFSFYGLSYSDTS
jgi:hypothetical protein